ncbi:MAG: DUF6794 domain-containing protein [Saprospiraceae bacterium]
MVKKSLSILFIILFIVSLSYGQENKTFPTTKEEIESQYEANAKKATINGTYIPKDLDDALGRLESLSSEESLNKFKMADENGIDRKLHFGLGTWMIVNWYFYEGSRFEHYLRDMGLLHPDDMADFMIICLHRKLNGEDLNTEELINSYNKARKIEMEKKKEKEKAKSNFINDSK